MMKPARRQRLTIILLMLSGVGVAVYLALNAFNENLMYFYSTSEVSEGKVPEKTLFRIGGMVVDGSVNRPREDLMVQFDLTDFAQQVTVQYTGILPDLFREGQGIVAKGRLNQQGIFVAEEVLAKHDENYMPPEVAASLKKKKNDT